MVKALGLVASFIAMGQVLGGLPKAIDSLKSLKNVKNDIAALISEVGIYSSSSPHPVSFPQLTLILGTLPISSTSARPNSTWKKHLGL